ncbi:hypothetical protein PG996_002793 [Apiospora saccharicola]|uniref:Uncharacterized protein n=1 Tax=Apiospora saccharicola TaxID=335842 RepID=A0ABR1WKJ3_9PEZI
MPTNDVAPERFPRPLGFADLRGVATSVLEAQYLESEEPDGGGPTVLMRNSRADSCHGLTPCQQPQPRVVLVPPSETRGRSSKTL